MRRRLAWAAAASVVLVGVMFVAGFPLHTYLQQRSQLIATQQEARTLGLESRSLSAQIHRLDTDAEVERLARQYYGMVKPGEQAFALLPQPTSGPPTPTATKGSSAEHEDAHKSLWSKITSEFSF